MGCAPGVTRVARLPSPMLLLVAATTPAGTGAFERLDGDAQPGPRAKRSGGRACTDVRRRRCFCRASAVGGRHHCARCGLLCGTGLVKAGCCIRICEARVGSCSRLDQWVCGCRQVFFSCFSKDVLKYLGSCSRTSAACALRVLWLPTPPPPALTACFLQHVGGPAGSCKLDATGCRLLHGPYSVGICSVQRDAASAWYTWLGACMVHECGYMTSYDGALKCQIAVVVRPVGG